MSPKSEAGTPGTPGPTQPIRITPISLAREAADLQRRIRDGLERIAAFTEDELAIATTPKDAVWREDMVTLYRYQPTDAAPLGIPVLIVYALVGRYQMVDLEADRSFVRKLLDQGLTVYLIDWGIPGRGQRHATLDDYVSGYLDDAVDEVRRLEAVDRINILGICQGGVFSTCYTALFPEKVANLVLTVTPLDFHGRDDEDGGEGEGGGGDHGDGGGDSSGRDARAGAAPAPRRRPERGSAYMNLWVNELTGDDIDRYIDARGNVAGSAVGLSFLMMNPVANVAKYTTDLLDIVDDERKLLTFLRMERWIADRPATPGELARQWLRDLYQDNRLIANRLELGDRTVDLGQITMPVLNVYAEGDVVIPNWSTRGADAWFGTDDYTEVGVPGGHVGTFVGGKAQGVLVPTIVDWLRGHSGK